MKILVFSDSHGRSYTMREALMMHPDASAVIHLGDGERDLASLGDLLEGKKLVQVRGNCDFCSPLPDAEIFTAYGTDIYCTHGYVENVKASTDGLIAKARNIGARIALYGHTHQSVTKYIDGLYVMNPGSARVGEYGIIDIAPSGIMCSMAKV